MASGSSIAKIVVPFVLAGLVALVGFTVLLTGVRTAVDIAVCSHAGGDVLAVWYTVTVAVKETSD